MRLHPGEVEATGWRVEQVSDVVRRLRAASPGVAGRPRLIAIDGRGGAGKSTLVERLQAIAPASAVVHTDDIAWNHAFFDWSGVMIENILRPLHHGEPVEFRPLAWIEHDRPGAIRIPAGLDVVWLEGTGIIREELAQWIDASIWMQGDLDEQERRLVARDGNSPWHNATIVVAGTTHLDHNPDTEIVVASPTMPDPDGLDRRG
jgi:uridine kinase